MQWPDSHILLSTQVQLRECGQRFPGTQSTGGSGAREGEQVGHSLLTQTFLIPSHPSCCPFLALSI